MPNRNQWASFLGLAQRAGKVSSGEETVLRLIRQNKAKAVLLAADASDRTKKTITNKCDYYHVPLLTVPDREVLGQAIGQPSRVIIAVTDSGFAGQLIERIGPSSRG
ncbi:YlxQ family RNA-binding protein [Sporolactobacillus inulinus]|jgi:ribosomal protein L7Ae-like RNA K-turn-binding protein|uniref:50S ribosomal protein L7 n=1 Tax=Sporolactobacillus inulinus CASD TaxID=1069536 RepID=A0A0U1QQS6_9BACL|nr:YlxQ family RNA-binding protein [Sporolactobacillus inulinus]KLI03118.1 50S ribosomal protein L7 [Sporolactobacillus inulinus CASD]GEB75937.1 putative ribosomal protein YlxQ [Sporolactobacillus inulinus]